MKPRLLLESQHLAASTLLEGCVYFLNTWMLAKLGNETLAAGALVTNLFSSLVMVLWGVFSSSSMRFMPNIMVQVTKKALRVY